MAEVNRRLRRADKRLMENMRVNPGQRVKGGQSPGEQAMDGLADSLRDSKSLKRSGDFAICRTVSTPTRMTASAGQEQGHSRPRQGRKQRANGARQPVRTTAKGDPGQGPRINCGRRRALRDDCAPRGASAGDGTRRRTLPVFGMGPRRSLPMDGAEEGAARDDLARKRSTTSREAMESADREDAAALGEAMDRRQA